MLKFVVQFHLLFPILKLMIGSQRFLSSTQEIILNLHTDKFNIWLMRINIIIIIYIIII